MPTHVCFTPVIFVANNLEQFNLSKLIQESFVRTLVFTVVKCVEKYLKGVFFEEPY